MTRQYKTDINVTGASVSGSTVATQPWVSSTYSPLVSPTFTGTPLAPTASSGTATTQLATTQFVQSAVATQAALTASTGYTAYLYSTASTVLPQNTIVPATYNGTAVANGITYNGSSVTFVYPGYYNVDYNIQINGGGNGSIVNAWYRKNGVDIPNTNYEITLSNQNPASLIQGVYTGSFSSGDILQVMVLATGTSGMYMWAQGAVVGPPAQPSTPAVVLNISQVTYIQQGSSISGGSATNVTFINGTANFNSASISGSALATQSYVTGQGYQTSTGSVSYATNSGNSSSTSQTNFSALTISGSSVATQSFVNNKIYNQVIPFSVTGSVSAAGPWDYRFYNDTGGTRSINGVRASLGSAPSGSAMLIDVRKNGITGANSIFTASSISIPSGSITSGLISSGFNSGSSVASGDYLTVAVTQVGSTTAGSDLVVQIMWS